MCSLASDRLAEVMWLGLESMLQAVADHMYFVIDIVLNIAVFMYLFSCFCFFVCFFLGLSNEVFNTVGNISLRK